jgi:hypothetical protein
MALWGTADSIFSPGTVTVNYTNKTIVGSGTSFTAASVGSVISIGAGKTFGEAVITGITSDTLISIATTQYLSGSAISGVAYTMSQKPVYTLEDSNYSVAGAASTINAVYGVDPTEAASNVTTQYAVTHAGWVGIKTYMDNAGNLRVKSETLVAFSGITTGTATYTSFGDSGDDVVFPDRVITITSQPEDVVGISTTSIASFSVTASAVPTASLTYQWQYSSTGVAYTTLTSPLNNVVYTGTTGTTLGVGTTTSDTDRPDGYLFRVVVSTGDATPVTSDSAELIYD